MEIKDRRVKQQVSGSSSQAKKESEWGEELGNDKGSAEGRHHSETKDQTIAKKGRTLE